MLLIAIALATAVPPRYSVEVGGVGINAFKDSSYASNQVQLTLDLEAKVEWGGFFLGAVWMPDLSGDFTFPRQWFLGAKLGYAMSHWVVAPYLSCGIGYLHQEAYFNDDEGNPGSGGGLAFLPEAGIVIGRDRAYGRLWIFAFALVPTFEAAADYGAPGRGTIDSFGAGLRIGL